MKDWISVKNDMPAIMVPVDVWVNDRFKKRIADCFTDKHRKKFFKANLDSSWEEVKNVTHWMYVPQMPMD